MPRGTSSSFPALPTPRNFEAARRRDRPARSLRAVSLAWLVGPHRQPWAVVVQMTPSRAPEGYCSQQQGRSRGNPERLQSNGNSLTRDLEPTRKTLELADLLPLPTHELFFHQEGGCERVRFPLHAPLP